MKQIFLAVALIATLSAGAQNVAINADGSPADSSAILDVTAQNKGILLPRIFLTSNTDALAVPGPAPYLVVYNISVSTTNGLFGAGLYTNIGNALNPNWQRLGNSVPGPQGPAGTPATIKTGALMGSAITTIAPNSPVYVFSGPTAQVTVTANQKILLWGSIPMGLAAGSTRQFIIVGAGYQSTVPGSQLINMAGGSYSISEIRGERSTFAFTGSIQPGAGTYNIGCIVRNMGALPITDNDYLNAVYMIVDN
ncbi:MAG: hypothetical protein EOO06_08510 [Chitinophagaceae bacterium]|nr:MAG: hypothetical protein EOO06_08510 [Chitinophagaceae bacterium]